MPSVQNMRWARQNGYEWHPVPWAWFPVCFDNVTYWLEQPPYDRKIKWEHVCGPFYEYRRQTQNVGQWVSTG